MKKKIFFCVLFTIFLAMSIPAQQHFFLGVGGGAFTNLPTDTNSRAVAMFVNPAYCNDTFIQDDYSKIAPVASFMLGYGSKHFGVQLGVDALFNINENLLVENTEDNAANAIINYTYSSLNIPLMLNFFFTPSKIRFGFLLGAYFSIPLGDVDRELKGRPNFFTESTQDKPHPITESKSIPQDFTAGVRIGFLTEFGAGNGVFFLEIGYQREIFSGTTSMNFEAVINNGKAAIENNEHKLTLLGGPRVMLGYKYKFMFRGNNPASSTIVFPAQPALPVDNGVSTNENRYFMIVAENAEGPLSIQELTSLVEQRLLTPETMLWKKGMTSWAKAETFEELAYLFTAPN